MVNSVVDVGCFYCSTASGFFSMDTDQMLKQEYINEHQCVDVCLESDEYDQEISIDGQAWSRVFNDGQFDSQLIDKSCSTAFYQMAEYGVISDEEIEFGSHLVFDERVDMCYSFDPRDPQKRRLQELNSCDNQDCFNCAFTAGQCVWDQNLNLCMEPRKKID